MRLLIATLALLSSALLVGDATANVLTLALPSRDATAQDEARRLQALLLKEWTAEPAPRAPSGDLPLRITRAQGFALNGDMDQAASIYDAALEDGTRSLETISDAAAFVSAHVSRAAIALARGEAERARVLLRRLLTYDARFALLPGERSPQLRAVLDELLKATIPNVELTTLCRAADIVIVVRRTPAGLEFSRWDQCVRVAIVVTDSAAHAFERLKNPRPRSAMAARTDGVADRKRLVAGAVTLAIGLGLVVTGSVFAAQAGSRYDDLQTGCTTSMPCAGEELERRGDAYRQSAGIGAGLGGLGVAAAIAGGVFVYLGARHKSDGARRVTWLK